LTKTSVEWLMRFAVVRSPPAWAALGVSLAATAAAIATRGVIVGLATATSFSATSFPAFIIATLYGGAAWGWATLVLAVALGALTPASFPNGTSAGGVDLTFALSGALTVLAAAALRDTLLRLEETRRVQDETKHALDRSEARLRMAQDAAGVGLWDYDLATDKSVWSPAVYRSLGLDPSGPATMDELLKAVHPDDREKMRRRATGRDGRLDTVEYRVIWPDGQVRWLLSRGEVLRDPETGAVVGAAGANIDITERRCADEQLRESEARFRALADSAPIMMWVLAADGRREFINQASLDFLGLSNEEALQFDWRARIAPEDLAQALAARAAGEAARELYVMEGRYRRADGEWRWLRSVWRPRLGPAGDFHGYIGVGIDVTEARQAETDLKHINELLAERVEAALSERDAAEAALRHSQKLEALGQLTGGVAHDFNNLLTVIIGALDLIQRHPADTERRERMIEAALGAARRGERLTQQLLAFGRRQTLKPEPGRIDDLLAEAEPLLRRAVGEAVSFTVTLAAREAVAMVDLGQFEAAILNLVVNARDAVSPGGAIRVETHVCELAEGEVAETPAGPYVRLDVHDTGVGMTPATLARAFDPFFTTKEVGKGTGLGLSQVHGFAHQSGGGVTIESEPGKGATVRLYLPRTAAMPAIDDAAPAPPPAGPALNVLLVEDDAAVGDMVEAILEELGHAVMRADGVETALELLKSVLPFDLMLTDLIMPGALTGVDLSHEAVKLRPGLPVILSSGYTGEALASAEGAPWPLLRKPYSPEALAQALAAATSTPPQAA
jgi:PAS domain S-box-containing protein